MKNGILGMLVAVMLFGSNCSFSQTRTVVFPPVAQCLFELEKNFKTEAWFPISNIQKQFMQEIYPEAKILAQKVPMKTKVSDKANIINKFLEENGFQIKLNPFQKSEIGVASIMKVVANWEQKGTVTEIGKYPAYPAVKMTDGYRFKTWRHLDVFMPTTVSGEKIYMAMLPKPVIPESDFDLYRFAETFIEQIEDYGEDYDNVLFPMVSINQEVNIKWLIGMGLNVQGKSYSIFQAVQQNKLFMDENGATVESAVAMNIGKGISSGQFVIDKPFLLIIARDDVPILVGWIEQDSWKNPNK